MPKQFTDWMENNAERLENAKNKPYFITDNFVDGEIEKGLNWKQTPTHKFGYRGNNPELNAEETSAKYDSPENRKPTTLTEAQHDNINEVANRLNIVAGEPMEHYQADSGQVNVGKGASYQDNCVSCSFTYELRRRGLNVKSKPFTTPSEDNPLYIAGESYRKGVCQGYGLLFNGIEPSIAVAGKGVSVVTALEKITKKEGRYHLSWDWNEEYGHSIVAERLADHTLVLYDSQRNCYLDAYKYFGRVKAIEVYRVDNATINPDIVKDIVDVVRYRKKPKRR